MTNALYTRLLSEATGLLASLSEDELEVVLMILRGMKRGREKYGPLELSTDSRDMLKEALEEMRDFAVYASAKLMVLGRGR